MRDRDPGLVLLGWCIRNHQEDLLEAIELYGYQKVGRLIKLLMEIDQCQN